MNALYYGDNLSVLREHIKDESVDLIYLDPPFNSKANYNILFQTPKGQNSQAQIEAFKDTWEWGEQAEREFKELLDQSNTDVAKMMAALRGFLGENDMMAYLVMMANRLLEMYRVLKPTGALYLHCDPSASHYLKLCWMQYSARKATVMKLSGIMDSVPHFTNSILAASTTSYFITQNPT